MRFASYITAAARNNLFKQFHQIGFQNILYSDTDSLISTIPMNPTLIDEVKLGYWKLEHRVSSITIWGPKFYKITTEHGL